MKTFEIVKRSAKTSNGNFILSLRSEQVTKTKLGTQRKSEFYCAAVIADEHALNVGDKVELDINEFNVTNRDIVNESTGEVISLNWLKFK